MKCVLNQSRCTQNYVYTVHEKFGYPHGGPPQNERFYIISLPLYSILHLQLEYHKLEEIYDILVIFSLTIDKSLSFLSPPLHFLAL